MKRKLSIFFLCILLAFSFTGCKPIEVGVNEQTASYSDRMAIPEDGIVSADVFSNLKETSQVVTFEGESKGIKYEWTVFGSEITEPKDLNLLVTIIKTSDSTFIYNYASKEDFGFTPLLSIYSGEDYDGKVASLLEIRGNESCFLSDVYLTGENSNILNVSYDSQVGTYVIEISDEEETLQMASLGPESVEKESVNNSETSVKNESKTESKTESVTTGNSEKTAKTESTEFEYKPDEYLSKSSTGVGGAVTGSGTSSSGKTSSGRVLSDGTQTGKDQYLTDPVPYGKPQPVEPENQVVNKQNALTCTFSIECTTILNNLENLNENKMDAVPSNGIIFPAQTVTFYEGESVFDVLMRVCRENNIQVEYSWTPMYNSTYIEGIHNLYEFDCGSGSGWMYKVDGWYPNYGCSRYVLTNGETVEWRYTCDLGSDIGGHYVVGGE